MNHGKSYIYFAQRKHENALNSAIYYVAATQMAMHERAKERGRETEREKEKKKKRNGLNAEEYQVRINLLWVIVRHLSNYCIRI